MIGYDQAPRYAELVRRIWGEDSEILPPGLILELDRIEWAIHKREMHWTSGRVTIAASPANVSRVQISNPAGNNRITVVEKVIVLVTVAGAVAITVDGPVAATPAPCLAIDTRLPFAAGPGAPTVSTQSLIANNNAVIGGYDHSRFTATPAQNWFSFTLPKPIVLAPGHNVTVYDTTVNDAFQCFVYGYERPAEPEELTP